jgi:hypothetical protein
MGADVEVGPPVVGDRASGIVIDLGEDDESRVISECREWVVERGLAEGIESHELVDEETGDVLAIFDLAWPDGVQLELTEPVALLLNEPPDVGRVAAEHGFRFFTTVEALQAYVESEVLESEAA